MKNYASGGLRHRLKQSGHTFEELSLLSGVPADLLTRILRDGERCPRKEATQLLMVAYKLPDAPGGPAFTPGHWLTRNPAKERISSEGHHVSESTEEPPLAAEPTQYPIGSLARVEVMAARAARGEAIRHPRDVTRVIPPGSGSLAKA